MIWLAFLLILFWSIRLMWRGLRQANVEGCLLGIASMIVGYCGFGVVGALAAPFVLVAALSVIGAVFFS